MQKIANEKRHDLIDRNALIKNYDLHIVIGAGDNICIDIADIAKAPTVDAVEVKHGRWEEYPDRFHVRCTNCRVEFEKVKFPVVRNYCPNCGAKMDLKGE